MNRIKKLLSVLLTLAIIFSMAAPALAASFTDLEEHWAESYILDLNKRGYLNGYTDGTMKPDGIITACESLVFLSRFYTLTEVESEYIYDDYGDIAERYVPTSLNWAYDEVATCLAAGIISTNELKNLDLTKPIEKELMCVFLIRALNLDEDLPDSDDVELTFDDTDTITSGYLSYISVLVDAELVIGDENNNFTPHASITRAMAATLVSRGLDYIDEQDIDLSIEGYSDLVRVRGILTAMTTKTVQVRGLDGLNREFTLANNPTILVNGSEKAISSTYVGAFVELSSIDGAIQKLSIDSDSDVKWIQGPIHRTGSSSGKNYIEVDDYLTGKTDRYTVRDDTEISLNGDDVAFSKVAYGQFALMKIEDGVLVSIEAASGEYEFSGTVASITYAATIQFKVTDKSGTTFVFPLSVSDLPEVTRGDIDITIDRLSVGDSVQVTVEKAKIASISAVASQLSIDGVLSSTTNTASGVYWTITDSSGYDTTYQLDELAGAYKGSKTISLSDINIGDTVSVVVYGKVITEVELINSVVLSDKVTADVLAVDTDKKTITVLNGNKLLYIDCKSATIISALNGKTLKLASLTTDHKITAYGSFSSSANFTATSIIVEN